MHLFTVVGLGVISAYLAYIIPCFVIATGFTIRSPKLYETVVVNRIHRESLLPDDLISEIGKVTDGDKHKQLLLRKTELESEIELLRGQLRNFTEAAETADITDELDEKEMSALRRQFANGAEDSLKGATVPKKGRIPLVLTSIKGNGVQVGKKMWQVLLGGNDRMGDGIAKGENGKWCVKTDRAQFSFWSPYSLWGDSISVSADSGSDVAIELLLQRVVVYKSPTVTANDGTTTFSLPGPIRFSRVRVIAAQKGETTCIGSVVAHSV